MPEKSPELSLSFRDFLIEAKQHGYGMEGAAKRTLESGEYEIVYERDNLRYTDRWVGGDPYTGYEHVSAKHPDDSGEWLPVWGMSYRGKILNPELGGSVLQGLLSEFLAQPDANVPIRGPLNAWDKTKSYRYHLVYSAQSKLEDVEAGEQIYKTTDLGDRLMYSARFLGGLANRQKTLELSPQVWLSE